MNCIQICHTSQHGIEIVQLAKAMEELTNENAHGI